MSAWEARYWATDDLPLLGGVRRARSVAYEHEADAQSYLLTALATNRNSGRECEGHVVLTNRRADIVRHCGRTAQARGAVCPDCLHVIPRRN